MASNSDIAEAFAGILVFCLAVAVILVVVYIALWVLGILLGIGAAIGVGNALYNYQRAFASNIKREV